MKLAPDTPPPDKDPDGELVFPPEGMIDAVAGTTVANVVGVKLHPGGRIYDLDAGDASWARGDKIVIDSDRGVTIGTVAIASYRMPVREPLRRVLRRADAKDLAAADRNLVRAEEALRYAKERVRERRMPVKMFRCDLLLSGSKAIFYFSSEDRIDFRDVVRDLSHKLHLRVEMRQTGVRDEAKIVGGIGSCGRELCCTTFLPHFDPVSIKMAKDQGLVLNPTKVSGQCGRLKCCLVYEQAVYSEMRKGLPKMGKRVTTPAGEGRVVEVDVLRHRIRVAFEPGEFQTFPASAVSAVAPPPPQAPAGRRSLPVVTAVTDVGAATEPADVPDVPDGNDVAEIPEVAGVTDETAPPSDDESGGGAPPSE